MTNEKNIPFLLEKYNIPVPRYTSYPPANYFTSAFGAADYEGAIRASNAQSPTHLSFYIHIPFCRHLCHYCGCNSFPAMKQAEVDRYVSALHREMDAVIGMIDPSRQIAQIHYGGGSPTFLPVAVLKALNDHLLSAFSCIDHPEIAIECHPGYLDEAYWMALPEAGFNRFSIGIQDTREEVLKAVNRRPSLLPIDMIIQILRSTGGSINMDFLYGLPFQTRESFARTIEQAIAWQPDRLVTFSYAHVPWVNKQQLILEKAGLPAGEAKSGMFRDAEALLLAAGYRPIGLDHFVRREDELLLALEQQQLRRNFQGYCTRRTTGQVYAFGVTGISQLQGVYAQNAKEIGAYVERIEAGSLATVKGYRLNREECITKEVIETLMCNYAINWEELSDRLSLPIDTLIGATAYNEQTFRTFVEDGIITLNQRQISVTPEGKLFVRNVAASLDKLMMQTDKTFSKPV